MKLTLSSQNLGHVGFAHPGERDQGKAQCLDPADELFQVFQLFSVVAMRNHYNGVFALAKFLNQAQPRFQVGVGDVGRIQEEVVAVSRHACFLGFLIGDGDGGGAAVEEGFAFLFRQIS